MLAVDLICGEDDVQKIVENADVEEAKDKTSFWRRSELQEPIDALGLSGLLVLPQTFGCVSAPPVPLTFGGILWMKCNSSLEL